MFLLHVMLDRLWMLTCSTAHRTFTLLFRYFLLEAGHSHHHVPFFVMLSLFVVSIDEFHLVVFGQNDVFLSSMGGVGVFVLG